MEANRVLLQKKYTRIIISLADKMGISIENAMKLFYKSTVYQMLSSGETDLHCRSDYYIRDEIIIDIEYTKYAKDKFVNRMKAYEKALLNVNKEEWQKED